ncbi:MAG TPA: discoidin domain-containing protein [Amycolatopsis sp.]|nr:discoidin domain-containing protein [Amycolatopsis sp.]
MADASADTGSYVLTATDPGGDYAPTFTGNGFLAVRVPPTGQGYAPGTVAAEAQVAGFYAQPPGQVQQRATLPSWSTLAFGDGGQDFSLGTGTVAGWRQQIDLHTGVITTTATWTAPDGHVTDLRYDVFTDRARPAVAVVRLEMTPHWAGTATVTDLVDGTPATMSDETAKGWDTAAHRDWETVRAQGTGIDATLSTQDEFGPSVRGVADSPVGNDTSQNVGQSMAFGVTAGQSYTVTKYVGIGTTAGGGDPAASAAPQQSIAAAGLGYTRLLDENNSAWNALWAGRVDVLGNPTLATEVNASQFYLWSSTRDGVNWSVSPAGLSSNGYDGHIFWDAETWMYPSLLAQHPDLAVGMDDYRYDRLNAAEAHAGQTGSAGARFPWESALDGTEQIPPPTSINSEGLYEQHITADVALAQWQYYQATGDRAWLASRGWPVLSQAAAFWASRATPGANGSYHIDGVTGPDEENPDVSDEAYTDAGAAATLRMAAEAARVLGQSAPQSWTAIADGLTVAFDPATGTHPEFAGYQGQLVKQADVTMLQYPWAYPMPANVAQADIDYYVPRSDPGGPSMDDAINSIDTAALGSPGCATYAYTQRSIEPFMRDAFDQFSETRTGGAFTFATGIGGFLQEFLYGYSGLRWDTGAVSLDPSLTAQIGGIVLHNVSWQGRVFTVTIGQNSTRVALGSGAPLPVRVGNVTHTVGQASPLTVPTRRPDLAPTTDAARCQAAQASSAQPGADALAAVDGSPATDWQPAQSTATLTVPLAGDPSVGKVMLGWGQQYPPAPAPNVPPPPGPVTTLRATDYQLLASSDGQTWTTVAQVSGRASGTSDVLTFTPVHARYLRLRITGSTADTPPMLTEITVPTS